MILCLGEAKSWRLHIFPRTQHVLFLLRSLETLNVHSSTDIDTTLYLEHWPSVYNVEVFQTLQTIQLSKCPQSLLFIRRLKLKIQPNFCSSLLLPSLRSQIICTIIDAAKLCQQFPLCSLFANVYKTRFCEGKVCFKLKHRELKKSHHLRAISFIYLAKM